MLYFAGLSKSTSLGCTCSTVKIIVLRSDFVNVITRNGFDKMRLFGFEKPFSFGISYATRNIFRARSSFDIERTSSTVGVNVVSGDYELGISLHESRLSVI